jgi:3-oxoacyl-[acyl-carrier-protein] synthase-1
VFATATARETNLIKTETVCTGKGLTDAFRQVISAIPAPEMKIEQIICDMNGEPYRADEYGFASLRLSERFVDASDFQAPADCWGDVGAASGPLFLNLIAASVLRGYAKRELSLIWTSSEGGERSAALIRIEHQTRRAN